MGSFVEDVDDRCRKFHDEIVNICGRTRASVCSEGRGSSWYAGRSKEQFDSDETSGQISASIESQKYFPKDLLGFANELKIGTGRIGCINPNIKHQQDMIVFSNNALCGSNNVDFLLPKETTSSFSVSCTQPGTTINPRYGGVYRLRESEYYFILDGEFKCGIIKPANNGQEQKIESVASSSQSFVLEDIKCVGFKQNHERIINLVLPSLRSSLILDQLSLEIRRMLYEYFEFSSHRPFQYRCTDYSMLDGILGDMDFVLLPMRGFEFTTWWNIFELTQIYYSIINHYLPKEAIIPEVQRMKFIDLEWFKNPDSGENEKLVLIIRAKFWNPHIKKGINTLLQKL